MKLIIVDDEPAVRGSIRMLSNPEMLGFTMIEEASDGKEALKKLEKTKYDVMITDMRMPGMDGIMLLNSIREDLLPSTIVVSAYHDFEYMRLAMHKHAVDYLLKPIKQIELVAALRKAACESGRQYGFDQNERLNGLWWSVSGYPKKEFFRAFDGIPLNEEKCHLLYLRGIGFKNVMKQKYGNSRELMYYHIEQSISDYYSKIGIRQDIIILNESAEVLVLLHDVEKIDLNCQKEMERLIYEKTGVLCCCKHTLVKLELSRMFSSYEALRQKASEQAWDPSDGKLYPENGKETFSNCSLAVIRDAAQYAVQNTDFAILVKSIKEWENSVFNGIIPSLSALEDLASVYLKGLMDGLGKIGATLTDALEQFEGFQSLCCWLENKNMLISWMQAIGKVCIAHSLSIKRKRCSYVMKSMLDYVESNYTLDIGLEDLTKHFHMSREHISRMFKKETGENFIAYLTKLRMKKAVGLIKEAKLSMQMVAEEIGFNDASYFSRTFKKYFGISPDEYRRRSSDGVLD